MGLQLLITLYKFGGIPADEAIDVAERIHNSNPKHITRAIFADFIAKLKRVKRAAY